MPIPPPSKIFIIVSIIVSGICWYFSSSLPGNFWYLQWVAPVPVLYTAFRVKGWQAFIYTFIAYLIGRFSWLPYLLTVLPVMLAAMFTILPALVFALLAAVARKVVVKTQRWYTMFALPVLFTAFEYIMFIFSKDGTITSIAYSQCNFLPIVQVASLTGIQGITFLLMLVPFAASVALYYRKLGIHTKPIVIVTSIALITCLMFGTARLLYDGNLKKSYLPVGFTCLDEHIYKNMLDPNTANEINIARQYLQDVPTLAAKGAMLVMMPEKAIIVNDSSYNTIQQMFANTADTNHVGIVVGVTKIKKGFYENNCWVFDAKGNLLADYKKVNLFEGERLDGFNSGDTIAVFNSSFGGTQATAICKDMDFQQFLFKYSKAKPGVLYAPAWDFVEDGFLHSRMAMMRAVEGGYNLVRNAREGRITISDYRSKVLYETSTENKKHSTFMGNVPLQWHGSFYSETGDWFSYVCLVFTVFFIGLLVYKPRK